jgi:hypothetical protein
MLMCRGCSTRFESGRSHCPSCGRPARTHAVDASASDSGSGLPPPPPLEEEGLDLEVDESVLDEREPVVEEPARQEEVPVRTRPAPTPSPAAAPKPEKASPRSRKPAEAPSFALDAEQVRALLCEQPGLLEKGLGVYADPKGKPVGVDFETPVGDIDLLARDLRGGYVVVLVPEAADSDADLVPGLLRRMGWVRKHLCVGGETVRSIAVMNEVPESAVYAAAGLAEGVIRFVGYRITLEFHDHTS